MRLAVKVPSPGSAKRTLSEDISRVIDVLLTLEQVAARESRPADVTEQLLDQLTRSGSALHNIARGHGAAAARLRPQG